MKIIADNAVYVQKNDIAYLNSSNLPIPVSIFMKAFGQGTVIIDDTNRYEFIEFNDPKEIEFFKSIDWMIDYNEVKDISEEEAIYLAQSIGQEKNIIAKKYNSMSQEERKNNIDLVTQHELLDFKIYSLRDVLLFKEGHIKMNLPENIDLPTNMYKKKV